MRKIGRCDNRDSLPIMGIFNEDDSFNLSPSAIGNFASSPFTVHSSPFTALLIEPVQVFSGEFFQKWTDSARFVLPRFGVGNVEIVCGPGTGDIKQPALFFDVGALKISVILVNRSPMRKNVHLACGQENRMEL